jgi:hypothetical protein
MQIKAGSVRELNVPLVKRRTPEAQPVWFAWLRPPSSVDAALGDAIAWVAGAIACRIGVDLLLSLSVQFWIPGVLILIAPAAIAVTLATLAPRYSLLLGYRLTLVMVGLLIGGKL